MDTANEKTGRTSGSLSFQSVLVKMKDGEQGAVADGREYVPSAPLSDQFHRLASDNFRLPLPAQSIDATPYKERFGKTSSKQTAYWVVLGLRVATKANRLH